MDFWDNFRASEQKLNTSFTNRRSESDLKTRKHFAENGMIGGRFLLYAAVS